MYAQTTALLPTFKRAEFQGRMDKYAPPNIVSGVDINLEKVLKGTEPVDVSGSVLGDLYVTDAIRRLNDYRRYWNYYSGRHFTVDYDGGDKKTVWNYCRKIVDKRAGWITGKGFNFVTEKGNELVGETLDRVWGANNKCKLLRKSAKSSLAVGDTFWYFTVKSKDRQGKLLPKDKQSVKIVPINPAYVFPLYVEDDPTQMKACMIQFPMWGNAERRAMIFTAFYTADKIRFYVDYQPQTEIDNPLGMIPVVHIPNSEYGDNLFGASALQDILPLNDAYNNVAGSIAKILKYHGEPTTVVYGAKLQQMERGAGKVWSNLPPPGDCRVENLEMKGDLGSAEAHLARLEQQMYRHGRTPKICYDAEGMSTSHTTGIALQLMFQPLVEATIEGQEGFEVGIKQGNAIIASIHENIFGQNLMDWADTPESFLEMDVQWRSLLPRDEMAELDIAIKKIESGIWSKAEAMRRIAGVKDSEKLAMELAADQRAEIAIAAEKARALQLGTNPPNLSSVFLSSPFLSEDLLDIAQNFGDGSAVDGETAK